MACGQRRVTRSQHEAKKETPSPAADFSDNNYKSSEDFLSDANILNPSFVGHPSSRQKLSEFNSNMLRNWESQTAESKTRYRQQVLKGCDENLRGCQTLDFFRKDSKTVSILKKMAEEEKNLGARYRILMAAYEIKNRDTDPELDSLYLKDSAEYEAWLKANSKSDLISRHRQVVALLLQGSKSRPIEIGEIKYLDWYKIDASHDLSRSIREVLDVLSKSKMYQGQQLHPDMQNALKKIKEEKEGFYAVQKKIQKLTPTAFKLLNLKDFEGSFDEYFYMLDRVFYERISPQDMLIVFAGSRRDLGKLSETARKYVEMQMMGNILESNLAMAKGLKDEHVYADVLLREAMRVGQYNENRIQDFLRRSSAVQVFLDGAFQKQARTLDTSVISFFTSLPSNFKMFLTYPQMYAISYLLSKREAATKFQTSWGEIEIDPESILKWVFEGKYPPWFLYGHDRSSLPENEITLAVELLLKTETLKAFDISAEDFMQKFNETLLRGSYLANEQEQKTLSAFYVGEPWERFVAMCESLPKPEIPFDIHIDELGSSAHGKFIFQVGSELFVHRSEEWRRGPERLISIYFNQTPLKRRLTALSKALENYLLATSLKTEEVKAKIAKSEIPLKKLEATQTDFIQYYRQIQRKFDPCFTEIARHDMDLQLKVLRYEAEYIRQIHRQIKKIRQQNMTAVQVSALNEKEKTYASPGLPLLQSFDKDGFTFAARDSLMRIKQYMSVGLKTDSANLPPANPFIHILLPNVLKGSVLATEFREKVEWQEDENKFVGQVLRVLGSEQNPLNWLAKSGYLQIDTSLWAWPHALHVLYLAAPEGDKEKALNEFLDFPYRADKALSISPEEELWRKHLNRSNKFLSSQTVPFISDESQALAPYEYMIGLFGRQGRNPFLGQQAEKMMGPPKSAIYQEAEDFYLFARDIGPFSFKINISFTDYLHDVYKKEVKDYEGKLSLFLDGIERRYRADVEKGQLLKSSFIFLKRYEKDVYFTESALKNLQSYKFIFHQNTKEQFK